MIKFGINENTNIISVMKPTFKTVPIKKNILKVILYVPHEIIKSRFTLIKTISYFIDWANV